MISDKPVAAQFSSNRDDGGHQGPMSQQDTYGFGRNELHAQKLVQLVGCRDRNVQNQKPEAAFSLERGSRVQY